jgi:peptidoglycan biosynthesis protein MviN/MurJ (putative lipid II flippase)
LANAVGRSANVLIPLALVGIYGVTPETDRFFFVLALAFYFYSTLSYAAMEGSVPIAVRFNRSLSSQGILRMALATSAALLVIALMVQSCVAEYHIWYAVGFALMSGAGIANGFAAGVLHAHSRYHLPGLSWVLRLIPFCLFVAARQPVERLHFLAAGIGLADWLRLVLLIAFRPKPAPSHRLWGATAFLKRHLSNYLALATAMVLMGLNPIIDRLIAQASGPGSLSILDAGDRLYGILSTLSTIGVMTVLLTRLSQAASGKTLDKEWPAVIKMVIVWSGIWLVVGVMIGYGLFGEWLSDTTSLSEFESRSVQFTFWYYLPGLIPFTISIACIKRLQAVQRNWILAILSASMVALNIPASLALRAVLGVPGIALATSIVYTVYSLLLAASLSSASLKFKG